MWDTPTAPRGDPNGRHANKTRTEKNNIETKTNSNDMKRIPATLLWASSLLLLLPAASCTDTLGGDPDTDARAITFTPAAETRAAVDGGSLPDDFKVWGWYGEPTGSIDKNVFDGVIVTKGTDGWGYTGTQYWIPGMKYNFYGVYPVYHPTSDNNETTATVTSDGTITVTNFDCSETGADAVDLMTATDTRTLSNPIKDNETSAVTMKFQHELCKVAVVVKAEQGVSATINSATLYGIDIQGTLSGGSWTGLETPVGTRDTPFKLSGSKTVYSQTPEADLFGTLLLIPQGCQELKLDIAITRYGEQQEMQTISLGTSIAQWAAAQSYRYVLTIKANAITFGDFTVEEWGLTNTGGNINIGKQ